MSKEKTTASSTKVNKLVGGPTSPAAIPSSLPMFIASDVRCCWGIDNQILLKMVVGPCVWEERISHMIVLSSKNLSSTIRMIFPNASIYKREHFTILKQTEILQRGSRARIVGSTLRCSSHRTAVGRIPKGMPESSSVIPGSLWDPKHPNYRKQKNVSDPSILTRIRLMNETIDLFFFVDTLNAKVVSRMP